MITSKGCQLYGFIGGFAGFLSTSTLAIMAIERYFMIKNPYNALKNHSKSIISNLVRILEGILFYHQFESLNIHRLMSLIIRL